MQKKSQDFSMEDAQKLANSSAGKQLFSMLEQSNDPLLAQAQQQAAAGDKKALSRTIKEFLASDTGKAILKSLGR